MPASNGIPTIATSQFSTSLSSGNLAKVEGPANRGTLVPLTGWIGSLFLFFFHGKIVSHSFNLEYLLNINL